MPFVYRHSLAYTYGHLLRKALEDFKNRRNAHRIRPSRTAGCPSGVPDDLYSLPELTGSSLLCVMGWDVACYFNAGTCSYKKSLKTDMLLSDSCM